MNKAKIKRNIAKKKGYKRYHKKDRYGRNRNNNSMKKLFCIFLSFLLILFIPYKLQNPMQIWKNKDEEIQIEVDKENNEEEIQEEEEGDKTPEEEKVQDWVDGDTPHFVLDGRWNIGYTRTYYDVDVEGGIIASYGKYWNDEDMRVKNNFIQYHDEQYGWVNVYALNVDQMKEYGTVVTSTALGSIIEIKLPNEDKTHYGVVLDVCGACAKEKRIDVWVKNPYIAKENKTHIDDVVEFRFVRFGFDGETIVYGR